MRRSYWKNTAPYDAILALIVALVVLAALAVLGHADESQRAILLRAGATYSVVRGRVPDPAGSVSAVRDGSNVTITWDASPRVRTYLVEVSDDLEESWTTLTTTTNLSATDTITEGQTKTYRVTARNGLGSAASSDSSAVTYPEAPPAPEGLIAASDITFLGYYDLNDSDGYHRGFCIRRVGSDVRIMTHTFSPGNQGPLTEWSLTGRSYGNTITSAHRTNQWGVTGTRLFSMDHAHDSMWWDHDHNRLWYLQSVDYPYDGNPYYSSIHISSLTDGTGQVGTTYKVSLENIRDRKHHGGVMTVPESLQAAYGWPEFLVGFGGYASLLTAQSGASMGLACYAMPDPANYQANAPNYLCGPSNIGAVVPLADYKTLAERGHTDRGIRKYYGYTFTPDGGTHYGRPSGTFSKVDGNPVRGPINYYDGADYRIGENNGETPVAEPLAGTAPYYGYNGAIQYNTQNWTAGSAVCPWVWGDQYVGGFFSERGLCVVASCCSGRVYYRSSAGYTDEWIAELHVFDPVQLAEVTAGTRLKTQIQPKVIIPLVETADPYNSYYFHKYAAGYDPVDKRLYIQANRYARYPDPELNTRIYVYQINDP